MRKKTAKIVKQGVVIVKSLRESAWNLSLVPRAILKK